jgi:hypothetical protein
MTSTTSIFAIMNPPRYAPLKTMSSLVTELCKRMNRAALARSSPLVDGGEFEKQ